LESVALLGTGRNVSYFKIKNKKEISGSIFSISFESKTIKR
jgi:hypothetical protein